MDLYYDQCVLYRGKNYLRFTVSLLDSKSLYFLYDIEDKKFIYNDIEYNNLYNILDIGDIREIGEIGDIGEIEKKWRWYEDIVFRDYV